MKKMFEVIAAMAYVIAVVQCFVWFFTVTSDIWVSVWEKTKIWWHKVFHKTDNEYSSEINE